MRITTCMLWCVRTTIEFDSDVAEELARRRRDGQTTLRDDVNRLIRLGLTREREQASRASIARFNTPRFDSGRPLTSIDDVESAISLAEGEDHR